MAINPKLHGRINSDMNDLCDVCYWRKVAEDAHEQLEKLYPVTIDKENDLVCIKSVEQFDDYYGDMLDNGISVNVLSYKKSKEIFK